MTVEVGPAGAGWTIEGWLLVDGKSALRVLDHGGEAHDLRKPAPGEARPKLKDAMEALFGDRSLPKHRTAWVVRPGDYTVFCKAILKEGLPKEAPEGVFPRIAWDRSALESTGPSTPSSPRSPSAANRGPSAPWPRPSATSPIRRGRRSSMLTALEKLGLPALPAIRRRLATLDGKHPARTELTALAGRLAFTVAEVRFVGAHGKASDEVRKRTEAWRGKTVVGKDLLGALVSVTKALPAGARGVWVTLERPGDDTGACLTVRLVADRPIRKGLSPQLDAGKRIIVGDEPVLDGHSVLVGLGGIVTLGEIDWKDFSTKLDSALRAGPEQYVLLRFGCEERR